MIRKYIKLKTIYLYIVSFNANIFKQWIKVNLWILVEKLMWLRFQNGKDGFCTI